MYNIRYLIKVTATAKPNNPTFAGAVLTYYYGRNQILVGAHSEGVMPPEEMEFSSWLIKEHGYKIRNTKRAEQFWSSHVDDRYFIDLDNPDLWTYKAETVAYDLDNSSLTDTKEETTMKRQKTNLIKILEEFHESNKEVLRVPIEIPEHYSSAASAMESYRNCANRLKLNVLLRTGGNTLYIIKLAPDCIKNSVPKLCSNCANSLEDGFYNPEDCTCKDCVGANKWRAK